MKLLLLFAAGVGLDVRHAPLAEGGGETGGEGVRVGFGTIDAAPSITLDREDRTLLLEPLRLAPPSQEWLKAEVQFIRINHETGKTIFQFYDPDGESLKSGAKQHGRIVDTAVHESDNPYLVAQAKMQPLPVFYRRAIAKPGQLHPQYELTVGEPIEQNLFNQ